MDCGYRVYLLVEDKLIIELKSVEQIKGIHEVQLLTYSFVVKRFCTSARVLALDPSSLVVHFCLQ